MSKREQEFLLGRRQFVRLGLVSSPGILAVSGCGKKVKGMRLRPERMLGGMRRDEGEAPIPGAEWYVATDVGDGLSYRFPQGALAKAACITTDMLLDGNHMIVFYLTLKEGEEGRTFKFRFSGLNQCSFRVRMPFSLLDQNRWGIEREGAFLKPRCSGDRIDLGKVDRMTLEIHRKSPEPARWCMTPLIAAEDEVEKIAKPVLAKGPLLDELGQSAIHDWPAKSRNVAEVTERIGSQLRAAPNQKWPESWSRWGGWKAKRIGKGTGFFRTHHDGKRWWLVDPDGHAFWSAGLDCVRVDTTARFDGLETALAWLPDPKGEYRDIFRFVETSRGGGKYINYLAANMIRAFGPKEWHEKWAETALAEMRRLRFNTVGNWSEWEIAKQAQLPYVRPMHFRPKRCVNVYRDFPDVFHPDFPADAADYAGQLQDTANDPAFLGYFLMNEPEWGFSSEVPAQGMLFNTETCETRKELSRFLKKKYPDDAALSKAWGMPATFEQVASGKWSAVLTEAAVKDLTEFSVIMVERYFQTLSEACKAGDPNHLNLGMRWAGVPPAWAVRGMKFFDVYSFNCYRQKVPFEDTRKIHDLLRMPVLVGEWHFGALDVGLPSSGIGHLKNQTERAKAYRVYIEDAAANSYCVGAHWFTLYDESALGRFDGENYNIGFLDVCNRPYQELGAAAVASHEKIYEIASGRVKPFDAALEYLPMLY